MYTEQDLNMHELLHGRRCIYDELCLCEERCVNSTILQYNLSYEGIIWMNRFKERRPNPLPGAE